MSTTRTFTGEDIKSLDRIFRLNLINSIPGYKPANLIGTLSNSGTANLAIFNSVVHIGSNPPLLGFILRPRTVERHTYNNIIETGFYTINHVHEHMAEQAHYTSAKFPEGVSEFEQCHLTPEIREDFRAPFVKESAVKIGLEHVDDVLIKQNDTLLIIGEVKIVSLPEQCINDDGNLDFSPVQTVTVIGLNSYCRVESLFKLPYARIEDLPNFGAND